MVIIGYFFIPDDKTKTDDKIQTDNITGLLPVCEKNLQFSWRIAEKEYAVLTRYWQWFSG